MINIAPKLFSFILLSIVTIHLIIPYSNLRAQIIPNAEFENWTSVSGQFEEPDFWITNNAVNSVSVSKTTDSYSGNYAMQIINNGPSFEGPLPGYALTTFSSNGNIFDFFTCYLKCDSISGTGEGRIKIYGFLSGVKQQIGGWQTDSVYIEAFSKIDQLGNASGYTLLKVDNLNFIVGTSINLHEFNKNYIIYPNPTSDQSHLNFNNLNGEIFFLEIYNSHGKLVRIMEDIQVPLVVEKGNLRSGLYYFQIKSRDGLIHTGKWIIN